MFFTDQIRNFWYYSFTIFFIEPEIPDIQEEEEGGEAEGEQQKEEEEEEESLPVALPVSTPDGDSEDTSRKSTGKGPTI